MVKVNIDIDEVAAKRIQSLEKNVKSLERKLATRDKQIAELKSRWRATRPKVKEIQDVASNLCDLLEDTDIVEYARYGNTC